MNQPISSQDTNLPKEPEPFLVKVAKTAAYWGVMMAALGALFSQIPGLKRLYRNGAQQEAIDGAVIGSAMGAVFGCIESTAQHAKHPLAVENALLKEHAERSGASFAQREEEKKYHPLTAPTRAS